VSIEAILILFGIGIAAGLLSGMFGVGGGVVIVPSLLVVFAYVHPHHSYAVQTVIATSLFTIIFTSFSSTYKQAKNGNVVWLAAALIGVTSAVSVFLLSKAALNLPGETLKKIFSVVLLVVGIRMLFVSKNSDLTESSGSYRYNKVVCSSIGLISGAIAAFAGLGGGVFVTPLSHYLLKFPIKKAIGTSSAAIFITSIAGVSGYLINKPPDAEYIKYSIGMVDTLSALPIIVMSIPFAQAGVYINKKTHSKLLKRLFAVFLLIVSARMLFF
jgi:uncharacterized membrane protein YfcA